MVLASSKPHGPAFCGTRSFSAIVVQGRSSRASFTRNLAIGRRAHVRFGPQRSWYPVEAAMLPALQNGAEPLA